MLKKERTESISIIENAFFILTLIMLSFINFKIFEEVFKIIFK